MIAGMYMSCMGAAVQAARVDTIANNNANLNTTGFKPDFTTFIAVPSESVWKGMGRRESDLILEKTGGGTWMDQTTTDFTPGPLLPTKAPFDVAIQDDPGKVSFFKVRAGTEQEAQIRYTRNGNFMLASDGTLVTNTGLPVLSENDQPILIPAGGTVEIMENGNVNVVQNGQTVVAGRIGLASTDLASAQRGLTKSSDSLFEPKEGTTLTPGGGKMLKGTLEGSGTNPIYEMVTMIEGQRSYELNMRFLKMQDSSLGAAIQRLTGRG